LLKPFTYERFLLAVNKAKDYDEFTREKGKNKDDLKLTKISKREIKYF